MSVTPNTLSPIKFLLFSVVCYVVDYGEGGNMEIEKDIPIPRVNSYPYSELEVGDSFLIEDKSIHNVCNMNTRASKKFGYTLVARKVEGGIRVWRTA